MAGEDFGLLYASTFDGSLIGAGPVVFAVWSYVVANGYGGRVNLHPRKLAAVIGRVTEDDVREAIAFLCQPDPDSRTDTDDGRRLRHLAGVSYEIVNHDVYRNARALEEKRAYQRAKQRESRERRRSTTDVPILDLSKKSLTSVDPLLSSPSDLISSDPEGVQGEGDQAPPPTPAEPSRRAPPDFAPTAEQRARCADLGHDADKLAAKFKRTEFRREYGDWGLRFDVWIDQEPMSKRASSPPAGRARGRPWVRDEHRALAAERGLDLGGEAQRFAREYPPGVNGTDVSCVASAFLTHLRSAPALPSTAAA